MFQKFSDRPLHHRMDISGIYFRHGNKHKRPPGHFRVGYDEVRQRNDALTVEDDIQIDRPGKTLAFSGSVKLPFYGLETFQQTARFNRGRHLQHAIQEHMTSHSLGRFGFIQGRKRAQGAGTHALHKLDSTPDIPLPVSDIGTKTDKHSIQTGFRA
jgi:hypothetical protein